MALTQDAVTAVGARAGNQQGHHGIPPAAIVATSTPAITTPNARRRRRACGGTRCGCSGRFSNRCAAAGHGEIPDDDRRHRNRDHRAGAVPRGWES